MVAVNNHLPSRVLFARRLTASTNRRRPLRSSKREKNTSRHTGLDTTAVVLISGMTLGMMALQQTHSRLGHYALPIGGQRKQKVRGWLISMPACGQGTLINAVLRSGLRWQAMCTFLL